MSKFDRQLAVIGSLIVVIITSLLLFSLYSQVNLYEESIAKIIIGERIDYGALLMMSRALDFSIIKTSSLFLAFLLIFLGSIYVVRSTQETFKVGIDGGAPVTGSFETSSPGLAMIFLGTILVAVVIYSKSYIEYKPPLPSSQVSEESPPIKAKEFN